MAVNCFGGINSLIICINLSLSKLWLSIVILRLSQNIIFEVIYISFVLVLYFNMICRLNSFIAVSIVVMLILESLKECVGLLSVLEDPKFLM